MKILSLDPGPEQTAWVVYDAAARQVLAHAHEDNGKVRQLIRENATERYAHHLAIEDIIGYGMNVGAETFNTCKWIGRFIERWTPHNYSLITRKDVKLHLCDTARANDAAVRDALLQKWGGKVAAKGTRKHPGPLYGIASHRWSALAVAVTCAETVLTGATQ